VSKKGMLLWTLAAILLIIGYSLYRLQSSGHRLQVDPATAQEIENARQR
jgi:hypothetical protein